ncbi:XRE family transcriptional regulator [Marinobacterium zhoushanense]|uniref:XRE family transcriptional regulator n=1 Tax=Marinobacterium zhoushanense TaxID=1679163 RepID=A0ABQ1JYP1_9GAMM|nr:helix-turn-helix domain-containing protein [Marinobacterium zhoushanense]GGB82526.1 XRE family transcriptional regulator [Marinobacterium zhoushanense]
MDIGGNLKAFRKAHGLSQRELAKRAGVTNSTISMIEKNSVSPSISSLEKVLAGIPVTLTEFFASGQLDESTPCAIYRAEELPDVGSAGIIRKLIGSKLNERMLNMLDHYYPPRSVPDQPFAIDSDIAGIVVSGKIEMNVDLEPFTLEAGDAFYLEPGQDYQISNPFDLPCRLVTAAIRR